MTTNGALEERLLKRVAALNNFCMLPLEEKRANLSAARQVARQRLPAGMRDIRVSLDPGLHFPDRPYGHALNALINAIAKERRVHNQLGCATHSALEAPIGHTHQRSGRLLFFPTRMEEVDERVKELGGHLGEDEFLIRTWDYLCFFIAEPDVFEHRIFVAGGDRVHKTIPAEHRYAPSLSQNRERLRLSSVSIDAIPTRLMYCVVGGHW